MADQSLAVVAAAIGVAQILAETVRAMIARWIGGRGVGAQDAEQARLVREIAARVEQLHEWHSARDHQGVPMWYRSIRTEEVAAEVLEMMREALERLRRIQDLLERR